MCPQQTGHAQPESIIHHALQLRSAHKHIGDQEIDYTFVDIETLIDDFLKDVEELT